MRASRGIVVALLLVVSLVAMGGSAYGQKHPERHHIRKGNALYEEQRMEEAQEAYRRALQSTPSSVEGIFNLGDAQYAKGEYEAAESSFTSVVERGEEVDEELRAKAYYNLGNTQFQQQKLSEALESFKESMRLNPSDLEAKYNYSYTKKLLEQQENNPSPNGQGGDNQDKQDNQNQEGNQNSEQDGSNNSEQNQPQEGEDEPEEQNPDEREQNPDEGEQPEEPQGDKPEPSEGSEPREVEGPSPESEQLLNAVQAAEDKTREKIDAEKGVGVARSGKNW